MRNLVTGSFVALVAVLASTQFLCAQNSPQASAETPATKAQPFNIHDVSGIWRMLPPGRTTNVAQAVGAGASHPMLSDTRPPMTPWGMAKWSQTRPSAEKPPLSYVFLPDQKDWNDPLFLCDPAGYPRTGGGNTLYRFVQLPDEVVEFFERDHIWRDLWTDGRKLPGNDAKPRWYGYSVAHWDGNTLVVASNRFDDRTWLDRSGSIHSDQMQLEERYTRVDRDRLEFSMTLTDPKAYTAPWPGTGKQVMERMSTSDGIPRGVWGSKSDGTVYGDIREDLCVYSEEHSFWKDDNPTGQGDNFGDLVSGGANRK